MHPVVSDEAPVLASTLAWSSYQLKYYEFTDCKLSRSTILYEPQQFSENNFSPGDIERFTTVAYFRRMVSEGVHGSVVGQTMLLLTGRTGMPEGGKGAGYLDNENV